MPELISESSLDTAPVGLYVLVGSDGLPQEQRMDRYDPIKDEFVKDVPCRLLGRVSEKTELPIGVRRAYIRGDGKRVIIDWAIIAFSRHSYCIRNGSGVK